MSGSILDGSAENIQALDHGEGFAVIGVSAVPNPFSPGVGVRGFSGTPISDAFVPPPDPIHGTDHIGVFGIANAGNSVGVVGVNDAGGGFGVFGSSLRGVGVRGMNDGGNGLTPDTGSGVWGESVNGIGVYGSSENSVGLRGESVKGIGVFGSSGNENADAGFFDGSVTITQTLKVQNLTTLNDLQVNGQLIGDHKCTGKISALDIELTGGDCAEDFDIAGADEIEPGSVMVVDRNGALRPCDECYDKKVAGVISGAGDCKPGVTLGKRQSASPRLPVALLGRVYCKVDAEYGPIEVGDLLTTSLTRGHAMKVGEPLRAFGAVIGKALRPLEAGRGLIPILVALQ